MVNSGASWSQRQGVHYRRLCARPGCGASATATLRFQPTRRLAWLVDLDETTSRTQGDLCQRHAVAIVLPRGWELHDERTVGPRLVEQPPAEDSKETPPRRVRVRRRETESDRERPPYHLPGFEPVVVPNGDIAEVESHASRAVPAQFGANDDDETDLDDDALIAILDARTPLLRRAFRNSKPDA